MPLNPIYCLACRVSSSIPLCKQSFPGKHSSGAGPQPVAPSPARGTVPSPGHRPQPRAHGPRAGFRLGSSERGGQGRSRAFSSEAVGVVRKGRCGQGIGKPVVGVWLAEQDLLPRPWVAWKSLTGSGSSPKEGCQSREGSGPSRGVCCSTTAPHSPEPRPGSPASGHLPNSPSSSRVGGPEHAVAAAAPAVFLKCRASL